MTYATFPTKPRRSKPIFEYDDKEKTVYYSGTLFFLKGKFANGFLLGFHSDNPCGCVHDGDVGWGVFDLENKTMIDSHETKMYGICTGDDWRGWMKYLKEEYGKITYFKQENSNEHRWSLSRDC